MKRYKIEFTDRKKEIFNTGIESDIVRSSSMSICAYMEKLIDETGTGRIEISLRKFHKRYIRHHDKISLGTLANRLKQLEELKLIKIIRIGQKFIYELNRNLDRILDSSNKAQAIDMTEVEEDCQKPKYKILNNNIYNKYITASESDAICNEVIKELGIKRKIVKNAIKLRIKQFADKINPAGAYQYIMKVAIDTYNYFKISAERANKLITIQKNKKKSTNTRKTLKFQNYDQRPYNPADEEYLLGWDIDDDNVVPVVIGANTAESNTKEILNGKVELVEYGDDDELLGWDE